MKQKLLTILLMSVMTCVSFFMSPEQAEAVQVKINNHLGKTLTVAVVHFDESLNAWVCQGWWNVAGGSFRSLNFPKHARSSVYVHMYNSDYSWGDDKVWTVRHEPFRYVIGKGCPAGTNRRQVAFDRYEIGQDGTVHISVE